MIKNQYHGKQYYMVLKDKKELDYAIKMISMEWDLRWEPFYTEHDETDRYIIISESKRESFRGKKYAAWERVKRRVYQRRRYGKEV